MYCKRERKRKNVKEEDIYNGALAWFAERFSVFFNAAATVIVSAGES
jgi:hypothetical protein